MKCFSINKFTKSRLPFRKNADKGSTIEVMEFNSTNIDSASMVKYLEHLRKEFKLKSLWVTTKVVHGQVRCIIKCFPYDYLAQMYFADRCPAMIENEIKEFIIQSKVIEVLEDEEDKKHEDYAPSTCFVAGLPLAECYQIAKEDDKSLKYPTIILQERKPDYVFVFRVGLPIDYKFTGTFSDPVNLLKFLVEFYNEKFVNKVSEDEEDWLYINSVECPYGLTNCLVYTVTVSDLDFINYLEDILDKGRCKQLFNELNSKLRKYIVP